MNYNNKDVKMLFIGGPRNGEVIDTKLLQSSYKMVDEARKGDYFEMYTAPMSKDHIIMYYHDEPIEKSIEKLIHLLNERNNS